MMNIGGCSTEIVFFLLHFLILALPGWCSVREESLDTGWSVEAGIGWMDPSSIIESIHASAHFDRYLFFTYCTVRSADDV